MVRISTFVLLLCLVGTATTSAQKSAQKISASEGDLVPTRNGFDFLGTSVASLGDVDGDGPMNLAVGVPGDDGGASDAGAVWVVFLEGDGSYKDRQKISAITGGFTGVLEEDDLFGHAVADIGDLNGDGFRDLAVGAIGDDDGAEDAGAVWVLFLNENGTVKNHQKISTTVSIVADSLTGFDNFGSAVAGLGDLDNDNIPDLAVGASGDDDGCPTTNTDCDRGAVWVLFMRADGTVKDHKKISAADSSFTEMLADGDKFGSSVAGLDFDDDRRTDALAVGAVGDDEGCPKEDNPNTSVDESDCNLGAVWIVFLKSDETVKNTTKIGKEEIEAFGDNLALAPDDTLDTLTEGDAFGWSVSAGDLDNDDVPDLAVGAVGDRGKRGAVRLLFLNKNGTVKDQRKINDRIVPGGFGDNLSLELFDELGSAVAMRKINDRIGAGGLTDTLSLDFFDEFGSAVAIQYFKDMSPRLAIGARGDDGANLNEGAVWSMFWGHDVRTVNSVMKTSDRFFSSDLETEAMFGSSVAGLGDLDGDNIPDLAVGAIGDDGEAEDAGAVWVLFLNRDGTLKARHKISTDESNIELADYDFFGNSVAGLGNLDGDAIPDLAVGAWGTDGFRGAVWVLFMNRDGTVKQFQKIDNPAGERGFFFGFSLASLGDLDGDEFPDLAVGALGADLFQGAVWVLFMNRDGTVKDQKKIGANQDGLMLEEFDLFGSSVANLGDLDGDNIPDLAVGATGDDDGCPMDDSSTPLDESDCDRGAVWVLFMDQDGTVKDQKKISAADSSFTGMLADGDNFGSSVAGPHDLNRDGVPDLVVGANRDSDGSGRPGAVWVLFMNRDGTVKKHLKISATQGDYDDLDLDPEDAFGSSVASLGDLDEDKVEDIAVGAIGDSDGGPGSGAVWVLNRLFNPLPRIDTTAITITPLSPENGKKITVTAPISDNTKIIEPEISFRRAGDASFLSALMKRQSGTDTSGVYTHTILEIFADSRSVEYYLEARDDDDGSARTDTFSIPIVVPDGLTKSAPQPSNKPEEDYRLISIPLDLEDPSPRTVLQDNIGPYNPVEWRFYGLEEVEQEEDEQEENLQYIEFPNTSDMKPGKAFFLLVTVPGILIDTGPGTTVKTAEPFPIPLNPGWNFIGNPFNFDIPTDALHFWLAHGDLHADDPMWFKGDWVSADTLKPFEGYAVHVQERDTLFIDPDLTAPESPPANGASAGEDEVLWSIDILAQSQQARDIDNVAAVVEKADSEWDRLDRPEPPLIPGDYVSVYFAHPEWKKRTARYSTDARPKPTDGAVWPFEVTTSVRDKVLLTFEGLDDVPPQYQVWLVDDIVQVSQNLRETNTYTVAGTIEPRPLKLVVGKRPFADDELQDSREIPTRFELFPNFPNPFNPSTTIRYGLPVASPVSLIIYNVLGEKVATLAAGTQQEAGYHAEVWDGRNAAGASVASGVYFARMRAGHFVQVQKMVLVK